MSTYGGVEIELHAFLTAALNGGTSRPSLFAMGKRPRYPLDRRLGGPQSRSGHGGEEKNSQPLSALEPLIIQPIAQLCTIAERNIVTSQLQKCLLCAILPVRTIASSGFIPVL
jgi:hypothetical protein